MASWFEDYFNAPQRAGTLEKKIYDALSAPSSGTGGQVVGGRIVNKPATVAPITGNVQGVQPLQTSAPTPSVPRTQNFMAGMGQPPKPALPAAPNPYGALPNFGNVQTPPNAKMRPSVAPVMPTSPGPGAGGYAPVAGLQDGYARSFGIGSQDGVPQFRTDYATPQGSMSIQGPSQHQGGGTLSFLSGVDPAQTEAAAQKVADYDRATAALRSLREVQNPGITQSGGASLQDMIDASDPYAGRTYQLDSMTGGQRKAADAQRAAAASKAAEQYGRLLEAARTQQGALGVARINASQRAQEAAMKDATDRGRLNLDAARYGAAAPYENALRQAQASKATSDATAQGYANNVMKTLLGSLSPGQAQSMGPDAYRELLYKYGLMMQGKAAPNPTDMQYMLGMSK